MLLLVLILLHLTSILQCHFVNFLLLFVSTNICFVQFFNTFLFKLWLQLKYVVMSYVNSFLYNNSELRIACPYKIVYITAKALYGVKQKYTAISLPLALTHTHTHRHEDKHSSTRYLGFTDTECCHLVSKLATHRQYTCQIFTTTCQYNLNTYVNFYKFESAVTNHTINIFL